jgi:hypothetical protein
LSLEDELLALLGSGRRAHIAAAYHGFDGMGGRSLRAVGAEYGLTYERVRQIAAAQEQQIRGRPVATPALDRTIKFIVDRLPARAEEIEAKLQSRRLTVGLFRLEGVLRAAKLLHSEARFSITRIDGARLVHSKRHGSFHTILRVAAGIVSNQGAATVSEVLSQMRGTRSSQCNKSLVVNVLACRPSFRWLDEATGWFWFSNSYRNPVLSRMIKILSVANPVRASELWAGIARDHRMRRFSVPSDILLELCRQVPGLHVRGDAIRAKPKIRPDQVLDEAERKFACILSKNGGIMKRSQLEPMCLAAGMKQSTFFHHLLYSPIISRYAAGIYGLRGQAREQAWLQSERS